MREWFVWAATRAGGQPLNGEVIHVTYGTESSIPPQRMYCGVKIPLDQRSYSQLTPSGQHWSTIRVDTQDVGICLDCMAARESVGL